MIPMGLEDEGYKYFHKGFYITEDELLKIPEKYKIPGVYNYDFCMLGNEEEIKYLKSCGVDEEHLITDYFGFKILKPINVVIINFDFTNGNELSYLEAYEKYKKKESFETCDTSYFESDALEHYTDVIILKKDSSFISLKDLIVNKGKAYCEKEIRVEHKLSKMLRNGRFNFKDFNQVEKENTIPALRDNYLCFLCEFIIKEKIWTNY